MRVSYLQEIFANIQSINHLSLILVSGVPPQEPVVSPKSGSVFEKKLIIQYIEKHGTDPISNEPLDIEDLVEIKISPIVPAKPPTLTSIPSMLSAFQNEWDAMALESFSLRQQLTESKKELSTALYHYEAAVRVIARLTNERDQARDALTKLSASFAKGEDNTEQKDEIEISTSTSLPDDIKAKLEEKHSELVSIRKATSKVVPKDYFNISSLSNYNIFKTSSKLLNADSNITSYLIADEHKYITVGYESGYIINYSLIDDSIIDTKQLDDDDNSSVISILKGGIIILKNGKIFSINDNNYKSIYNLKKNIDNDEIISIIQHPASNDLIIIITENKWVFFNLSNKKALIEIKLDNKPLIGKLHPDGRLLAIAFKDKIDIYDIEGRLAATFKEEIDSNNSIVENYDLNFAENGVWLISSKGNKITIWSLKKTDEVLKTIILNENKKDSEIIKIKNFSIDLKSKYLSISTNLGIKLYSYNKRSKEWREINNISIESLDEEIIGTVWGNLAQYIIVVGSSAISVIRE